MQVSVNIKKLIANEEAVFKKIERKRRTALKRAGGLIRSASRRSMRKPSQKQRIAKQSGEWQMTKPRAGKPPLRWMNRRRGGGLYRMMLFTYDDRVKSVVVGPVGFGKAKVGGAVPGQVEAGGMRRIRNAQRRKRRIGSGGEFKVSHSRQVSTRGGMRRTQKAVTNFRGVRQYVTYGQIRTQQQARRANQLNAQLYGPETMTLNAKPHEYMGPVVRNPQVKTKITGFFGDN